MPNVQSLEKTYIKDVPLYIIFSSGSSMYYDTVYIV